MNVRKYEEEDKRCEGLGMRWDGMERRRSVEQGYGG